MIFEEFDFMMFSQLEDTRDVLFRILQNRELPLQERMTAAEQLAEQYQICMEEQRELWISMTCFGSMKSIWKREP